MGGEGEAPDEFGRGRENIPVCTEAQKKKKKDEARAEEER